MEPITELPFPKEELDGASIQLSISGTKQVGTLRVSDDGVVITSYSGDMPESSFFWDANLSQRAVNLIERHPNPDVAKWLLPDRV